MMTANPCPLSRSTGPQSRSVPTSVQFGSGAPLAVTTPNRLQAGPSGRVSVSVTSLASPIPLLTTLTANLTRSPASTTLSAAILLTTMLGHSTATVPTPPAISSVPSLTRARLITAPQVSGVVGDTMWTAKPSPGSRSTGPQVRVPVVMAQVGVGPPGSGIGVTVSTVQLNPAFAGS